MPVRRDVVFVACAAVAASLALIFYTAPEEVSAPPAPPACPVHNVLPISDTDFAALLQAQKAFVTDDLTRRPDLSYRRFTQQQITQLLAVQNEKSEPRHPAILARANLAGSVFDSLNLTGLEFPGADLTCASFTAATLDQTQFFGADLTRAKFLEVKSAKDARFATTMPSTDFFNAHLDGAFLAGALLAGASFDRTSLKDVNLAGANLTDAAWAPVSVPAGADLGSLKGLRTLQPVAPTVPGPGQTKPVLSGMQVLRIALRSAGEITAADEVTRAYEAARTAELFANAKGEGGIWDYLLAESRTVLWGWMTNYGLSPWRCLLGELMVLLLGVPFYLSQVPVAPNIDTDRLLIRLPKDAPRELNQQMVVGADDEFTRVHGGRFLYRIGFALHASLTGTIGVGVGDINLAEWLARLRIGDTELVATGWPRIVIGVQSLLSTLILAIWALALFGEPFN
jgi:uncharacterized protein YjbI with pentapeptide repeats